MSGVTRLKATKMKKNFNLPKALKVILVKSTLIKLVIRFKIKIIQ